MWSNDRPTAPGFYWCHQRGKTRIVHIWCYKNGTELFTNEDGGVAIKDALYDGAQWMAAVNPPNPQDQNESAQPAPSFADAYQGAMEEVAIWKKRALEAEDLNRRFVAEINGHTHMGEPVQPAPSVPNDVIEQAVNRFLSWKLPKDFQPDGGMVFIPTKGHGYNSPYWPRGTNLFNAEQAREMLRHVLAAAPEAKP